MEFTYEEFKLCVRSAILTHKASFDLDVQELTDLQIAKVIVWCERGGYGYEYDKDSKVIKIEILKGFSKKN